MSSLGIPPLIESKLELEFAEAAAKSIIIFSCPGHNDGGEFIEFERIVVGLSSGERYHRRICSKLISFEKVIIAVETASIELK